MLNLPSLSPTQSATQGLATLLLCTFLLGCETFPWKKESPQNAQLQPAATTDLKATEPSAEIQPESDKITANQAAGPSNETPAVNSKPETVWQRLLAGYRLDKPMNKRVQREYDWYIKHPEYLERTQQRSEPFMHLILNEVEKRNLPTELALLPIVESAFQPFAYSHGRASGLWQFIPSTGKHYGLEQNWWYDGRRDVLASTAAALDYLQTLSNQFNGDWEHALASYNAGGGNVRKAIRKNKRKGKATDFWSLKLPRETQAYVPRLLAISKVFEDADKLGIPLREIPDTPQLAVVKVKQQIDLAKVAEMADISIEQVYELNPGFNRWATMPGKSSKLLLPIEKQADFEARLARLNPQDLVQWQRYKIKKGDVLGKIAKRHHTTVAIIKDVNKLTNHRIRAGKFLLIPVASKNSEAYKLAASERLKKKQSVKRSGNKLEYIIQPGDTLWDISREYKVSHKSLASWNGIAPGDTLRPGQKLVIWTRSSGTLLAFSDTPANRTSNIRYTIRKGDSLSRIADKFNVSVNDLKKWNRLNQRYLQPGQQLKLKVKITEQM